MYAKMYHGNALLRNNFQHQIFSGFPLKGLADYLEDERKNKLKLKKLGNTCVVESSMREQFSVAASTKHKHRVA